MSTSAQDIIRDAYQHPRHRGELAGATHSHERENPMCGDMVRVQLRVEGGRVAEAAFQGRGCALSQASAELILDRIEGQPVASLHELDKRVILEELGLPNLSPARLTCALLAVQALKGAIGGL